MTFLLDHLIAILVGATLLGALVFMQQRTQQSAIETTIRHRTETQASSFVETLSRDLENMRTSRQIKTGLGEWVDDIHGSQNDRAFGIYGTDTHTDRVEMVTLKDPDAGSGSGLVAVAYETVATGESVEVGGVTMPLYRVDRYVFEPGMTGWEQRGGSSATLTSFSLEATRLGGGTLTDGRIDDAPAAVSIVLTAAEDRLGRKSGDQEATTRTNATRQALTIRNVNAAATGDATDVAPPGGPGDIPLFPGVDPPAPPSGGPGGNNGGGSNTGSNGGGSTTGGPTTPIFGNPALGT